MNFSEELSWRGLVKDKTFDSLDWLNAPKVFYLGVDCSEDSLTVGNLAVLMLASRLIDVGWEAILLVGGATSLIGDPGGKNDERELKTREEISRNVTGIEKQVSALFAGKKFTLVDNFDWFQKIGYLGFLREVGKNFSMTELTQRDFIAARMGEGGSGISYAEFSYSLIQSFDFWHLYKNYQVQLQIGGSDQWGNMLSGISLIRKKENFEAHALSMPLVIDKSTGNKFGKSEAGAIWLDQTKTSLFEFYQFWLNTTDDNVLDYLKIYTLLSREEIDLLDRELKEAPGERAAQKALAGNVTKLVHGEEAANRVAKITETLFSGLGFKELVTSDFEELAKNLPHKVIEIKEIDLVDLLVMGELASSKTEARRFLDESAVYINGLQFSSEKTHLEPQDLINGYTVVRRGKNKHMIVRAS